MGEFRHRLGLAILLLVAIGAMGVGAGTSGAAPTRQGAASGKGKLGVTSSIGKGGQLSGQVAWTASTTTKVAKVEFLIDSSVRWSDQAAPYQYGAGGALDTTVLADGGHTFAVKAYGLAGQIATAEGSATVSNGAPPPPPAYGSIPRFGVATGYKILTRSAADRAYELDQIKAIGAKMVRFDSTPGNQSQVDAVVAAVLARGMEPMLILFGTTAPVSPT